MIPNFNQSGVLPPYLGNNPAVASRNSPYSTDILSVCQRFAWNDERVKILRGLLEYRERLEKIGLTNGYQILDGSFMEDCEKIKGRPPADIDILTFIHRPPNIASTVDLQNFVKAHPEVLYPHEAKANFFCDAYIVDLNAPPDNLVEMTRYWFSLFSHQRVTMQWKGTLRISLTRGHADADADGFLSGKAP